MRVFVTGATGFIGSAVVSELLSAGHQVVGLARSDASAQKLTAAGAEVRRGELTDLGALGAGAADADGVIHLAFVHGFDDYASSARTDQAAIDALAGPLVGTDRPLVVASGILGLTSGRAATEEDAPGPGTPRQSEAAAMAYTDRGVRVAVIRLAPTVHGRGDHGFVPHLIDIARQRGVAGYPGDGSQRWTAVHRLDAAVLFRRAVESARAGTSLHGVADEGVSVREITEVIGRHLGLPAVAVAEDDVAEHFGWIGRFLSMDAPATSTLTQQWLGWTPTHEELLADLDEGHYFAGQTSVLS